MRKWNASMPRERAPEGAADVVLAYRTSGGIRVELIAKMATGDAEMLMRSAIAFMHHLKVQNKHATHEAEALGDKGRGEA